MGLSLGARLLRMPSAAPRLLGAGFLVMAAAAILGGTVHGFGPQLEVSTKAVLWRLIYGGLGLGALLFLAAIALAVLPPPARPLVLSALVLRVAAHALGLRIGFVDYGAVLAFLLLGSLDLWLRRRDPGGPWLVAAALASVAGTVIQVSRLAPHPAFNHNDLFHVVGMLALWLFYRGMRPGGGRG